MRCSGIGKLAVAVILAAAVVASGVAYHYLAGVPLDQQAPKIELRLSNVDPPDPEPPCVIYRDIVDLPDPTWLGLTVRIFNDDTVTLYFTITGEGTEYSFSTVQYGSLSGGTNTYVNLDNFASRPKPAPGDLTDGELVEPVNLILRGYTDSGYSSLKWTFTKTLYVHWINSADPAFSVDVLNNFDGGTVEDWSQVLEVGASGGSSIEVATDYALSSPCSLKTTFYDKQYQAIGHFQVQGYIKKTFTTPNKSKVFAVLNFRLSGSLQWGPGVTGTLYPKFIEILRDDVVLVHLGKTYDAVLSSYFANDKWCRAVVPLPANSTFDLKLRGCIDWYLTSGYNYYEKRMHLWLDDFKIISK